MQGAPPELVVLAEDPLGRARMARRSKVHSDMSPAAVVEAVAAELGLRPTVTGLAEPVGTWAQLNESDLAFLRRLVGRLDGDLQIVGEELQVRCAARCGAANSPSSCMASLPGRGWWPTCRSRSARSPTAGWDPVGGSAVSGEASRLTHGGPGSGTAGADWLVRALEPRSEHLGHPRGGHRRRSPGGGRGGFRPAGAALRTRLDGVAEGNAQLRVGSNVAVTGLSPRWDNSYYVVEACHRYDVRAGYRTEFVGECAYLGGAS